MLMTLGLFVFELKSLPLKQLQRSANWRHPKSERVGERAARQFLGPGDETIDLSGTLMPEITGGPSNLDMVREMADQGKAWGLVDGNGSVWGQFVIESVQDTRSEFLPTGEARKIEFSLKLVRLDTRRTDQLGDLSDINNRYFIAVA